VAGIAVTADPDTSTLRPQVEALADRLSLPIADFHQSAFDAYLVVTDRRLELRAPASARMGGVYVDFLASSMRRRQREMTAARQLIARAVGFKGRPLTVIDATAGLGRDAFLLACLGCTVTAVERSPIILTLLADGLERAGADPDLGPIVRQRLRLVEADARGYLAALDEQHRPDVVYLDPMFPHRSKSALAKKEMRLCRLVAGDDPDAGELFDFAGAAARARVVVKRWLRAPDLGRPPAFSYRGRSVRSDVYPCGNESK